VLYRVILVLEFAPPNRGIRGQYLCCKGDAGTRKGTQVVVEKEASDVLNKLRQVV
jgi:hypothetical protein